MTKVVDPISRDTGLSVDHIKNTWTADDLREWARVERIRAQADFDQRTAKADDVFNGDDGAG
jgi:hypothetical protein